MIAYEELITKLRSQNHSDESHDASNVSKKMEEDMLATQQENVELMSENSRVSIQIQEYKEELEITLSKVSILDHKLSESMKQLEKEKSHQLNQTNNSEGLKLLQEVSGLCVLSMEQKVQDETLQEAIIYTCLQRGKHGGLSFS